jgi:hypothetical protein
MPPPAKWLRRLAAGRPRSVSLRVFHTAIALFRHRFLHALRESKLIRREEIQFFLRLHGLWEGIVTLPRPLPPPFDIETVEPIEPPWQAIKEWIPDDEPDLDGFNP